MTAGFLSDSLFEFRRMKRLADDAIAQLPADKFAAVPAAGDNSVAIIVKHLNGNMRSRWRDFLTTDGEKPDRDRDSEFRMDGADSREALLAQWEAAWKIVFGALEPLRDADLERTITIRGEPLRVGLAITRQLTHYSYHVGQIVFLAKHFAGPAWKSLSIPLGGSSAFNKKPTTYSGNAWK